MSEEAFFDLDRIEAITASLDLRQPNREALESIVFEVGQHFDLDGKPPPFEAVVDSATGAGKTYIMAAAIEYLAGIGVRDFAVITPGRTILEKTVANFTAGHPKSLLAGMEVHPEVITSENFATAAMGAAMDDSEQVKLYIFTVQALLKPQTSKVGRKTHKFQEGLGTAFYDHLRGLDKLVVFADEHHTYYGTAFSNAIRELKPWVLIGLTATPHRKTPEEQIIYRYPLAAAIADKLVKIALLVGRKDDLADPQTKLLDGIRLLKIKEQAIARLRKETGAPQVNPVMLVVAQTIADAEEVQQVVQEPSFAGGLYAGKVLTVHSDAPDEALAELEKLEDPDSPYRIVVSVGMLKEGWDVKNVYVIASLRASISDILTEQTLGRGMRLPFGKYTEVEILDSLEVLGHERYEDLLKKAGVLNEQFIDRRTRAVLRENAKGEKVVVKEETIVEAPLVAGEGATVEETEGGIITSVEEHTAAAEEQVTKLQVELPPRKGEAPLRIPRLRMTPVQSQFSLADITDLLSFRELGESLAADPVSELRRVALGARIVEGKDGLRRTVLVTTTAVDKVESPPVRLPLDGLQIDLTERVLASPVVPSRSTEQAAAEPIIDAFIKGLGDKAQDLLGVYLDRAAARLIQLITEKQREYAAKPSFDEVVEIVEFGPVRYGRPETSDDRFGTFRRGVGYEEFKKSMYAQDWFDSSTERSMANIIDDADEVKLWVRLLRNDLPILWSSGGRQYNPDFIVIEKDGGHWVTEVKMDKEMSSSDVKGKREAAQRWANHVSADKGVSVKWHYLLVSETDIRSAKGSWDALKKLGGQ